MRLSTKPISVFKIRYFLLLFWKIKYKYIKVYLNTILIYFTSTICYKIKMIRIICGRYFVHLYLYKFRSRSYINVHRYKLLSVNIFWLSDIDIISYDDRWTVFVFRRYKEAIKSICNVIFYVNCSITRLRQGNNRTDIKYCTIKVYLGFSEPLQFTGGKLA